MRVRWRETASWDGEFGGARIVGRRYHFHLPGLAFAGTLVVVMLGAINGQNNLLYWLFGLGVGTLVVSGLLSGASLMRLRARREVPSTATRGQALCVRYHIENRGWLVPACALRIEELPTIPANGPAPTWVGRCEVPPAFAEHVPAGERRDATAEFIPRRRGTMTFTAFRISTTFPFGLTRKSVIFTQPAEVLVRPACPEVPRERVPVELRDEGTTPIGLRRHAGDEFFALREYVPGDPSRLMAWKVSARLARPIVRELAGPPARRVYVVPAPETNGEEGELCVDAAAAVCRVALRTGHEVGVMLPAGQVVVPARSGMGSLVRCLDALALTPVGADTSEVRGPGRAVVVVVREHAPARAHSRVVEVTARSLGLNTPTPGTPSPSEPSPPQSAWRRLVRMWRQGP
jgi:uncharacterized protein (DUF58 family)